MDCPHRERAGWLCDSFFTARTAYDLSGQTLIEHNFIENYHLYDRPGELPKGMLPMCYPSDHSDGVFIPNWSLWFVLELEEYLNRSGDRVMVEALKPKVMELLRYFDGFKNEDGLLEKLKSWVFVEWSDANKFVQDVNYPTNMLYAGALDAASRMYGLPELANQAESIRETIRRQSFDGEFFVDNALRKEGRLEVTRNRSEVCQYFAFYFGVATPETHKKLWRILCEDFGPKRKETKAYPEVHEANAFVGNVLRLELLSRYGLCQQVADESVGYLLYMADRTGTLWENIDTRASCNHGFASHVCHTFYRDLLGLYRVDAVHKVVSLRFTDSKLKWCEGSVLVPGGTVRLSWRRDEGTCHYRITFPEGYKVETENLGGCRIIREGQMGLGKAH